MEQRWRVPGALPGGSKVAHLMVHGGIDPRYRESRCGTERSRTWKPVDLRISPAEPGRPVQGEHEDGPALAGQNGLVRMRFLRHE